MITHTLPLAFLIDGVGTPEVMFIALLVVMLFGGKKLPELARGLGKSVREFRKATSNVEAEIKRAIEEPVRETPKPRPPVANTLPTDLDLAEPPQPEAKTDTPPAPPPPAG